MNIVALDGHTLNPGDLTWEAIENLGEFKVHERSTPDQILERAEKATALLINKVVLNKEILTQLPHLKYIGVTATGYNNVDLVTAKKQGIVVTNVKAYSSNSVAQHTFGLILALCNHIELHSQSVKNGDWTQCPDFSYWKTTLTELAGKTIGLIGLGDIGSKVAEIANAMDMKVIAFRKNSNKDTENFIKLVALKTLFETSDVISLHVPLTEDTHDIINWDSIKQMKPTAFIINTGRGPLVNEHDLARALNENIIAGAGLDVLSSEPPKTDNPLFKAKNCIITPHNAWASFEARKRLLHMTAENIIAYQNGEPINVVG